MVPGNDEACRQANGTEGRGQAPAELDLSTGARDPVRSHSVASVTILAFAADFTLHVEISIGDSFELGIRLAAAA